MKNIIQAVTTLAVALLAAGCATPYMQARSHDAKDIFSFTVGKNCFGGIKARLGPVNAGIYGGMDSRGIRSGMPARDWKADGFEILILGFGGECFPSRTSAQGYGTAKSFLFISPPMNRALIIKPQTPGPEGHVAAFWTQFDIALGFYWPVRIGFNPGELLDFLLGWTTLDMYGDDAEYMRTARPTAPAGAPAGLGE